MRLKVCVLFDACMVGSCLPHLLISIAQFPRTSLSKQFMFIVLCVVDANLKPMKYVYRRASMLVIRFLVKDESGDEFTA